MTAASPSSVPFEDYLVAEAASEAKHHGWAISVDAVNG